MPRKYVSVKSPESVEALTKLKEEILKLYEQNKSVKEISDIVNRSKGTVTHHLVRMGKSIRGRGFGRSKVRENPFLIESEERDYWLGYLSADGNINSKTNSITIFTVSDKEHLMQYPKFIGSDLKPKHRTNANGNVLLTYGFGNKEAKEWLIDFGITPNKSKTLKLKYLNWNIIRGIFDGDGSAVRQIKITTGSLELVNQLTEFYTKHNLNWYVKTKGTISTCYDVLIRANSHVEFYKLLYANSTIYLKRKRLQYGSLLGNKYVQLGEFDKNLEVDNIEPSTNLND